MSTRFTALTIREGDAFLLEDNGRKCLFDSGVDDLIVRILNRKRIDNLDLAICSHNDADHANGFIELLESNIRIKEIWLPYWWASILQYAKDYPIDWKEMGCFDKDFKKKVLKGYDPESLFSEESESVPCDDFNNTLLALADRAGYEKENQLRFEKTIIQKIQHIVNRVVNELGDRISPDVVDCITNGVVGFISHKLDYVVEYDEITCDMARYVTYNIHEKHGNFLPWNYKRLIDDYCVRYLAERSLIDLINGFDCVHNLKIKYDNIMKIVVLATKSGCTIKWFEPTKRLTNIPIDYGFVALNSTNVCRVKKLKNTKAFVCALYLTEENQYSLVFEYQKEDVPIIRFSADSDGKWQSIPYRNNIIVTAPHHGAKANKKVYELDDEAVIWVRSDSFSKTQGRPCVEFKAMKNKYCLACKSNYFISEVCFEYDALSRKWMYNSGERCVC